MTHPERKPFQPKKALAAHRGRLKRLMDRAVNASDSASAAAFEQTADQVRREIAELEMGQKKQQKAKKKAGAGVRRKRHKKAIRAKGRAKGKGGGIQRPRTQWTTQWTYTLFGSGVQGGAPSLGKRR